MVRKLKIFDLLSIISCGAIVGWLISDYFGGMVMFLFSYFALIATFIVLYFISLIETIISICKNRFKTSTIKIISHSIVFIFILSSYIYDSDLFKSKRFLTAILQDDQFMYTLKLREDGNCENVINGIFGFKKTYKGKYHLIGDTIVFTIKPYDNNFLPDTILMDKKLNAIFINRINKREFDKSKEDATYFKIN